MLMNATDERPILVLGATGGQGGAVAAALLARGARVRAMVRRPEEPAVQRLTERGVEAVGGSLDDAASLGAYLHGRAARDVERIRPGRQLIAGDLIEALSAARRPAASPGTPARSPGRPTASR